MQWKIHRMVPFYAPVANWNVCVDSLTLSIALRSPRGSFSCRQRTVSGENCPHAEDCRATGEHLPPQIPVEGDFSSPASSGSVQGAFCIHCSVPLVDEGNFSGHIKDSLSAIGSHLGGGKLSSKVSWSHILPTLVLPALGFLDGKKNQGSSLVNLLFVCLWTPTLFPLWKQPVAHPFPPLLLSGTLQSSSSCVSDWDLPSRVLIKDTESALRTTLVTHGVAF